MKRSLIVAGIASVAVWALPGGAALAQFYKGKTITMIINYPPGGPSDIEGRIMARHLPKHIAGEPKVIVKNVGGGAGMIGSNYLGEVAKPDGRTIGFFTWNIIAGILGDPGLRVNYPEYEVISGVRNPLVYYMRKDTPPGISQPADIMKARGIKALSLDVQSTNSVNQSLSLDILGANYTPVPGYRGLKDVETAILQNEGQLANTSLPGWTASIVPTMLKQGLVTPLWQLNAADSDGSIRRYKVIGDIATFEEVYERVHGKKPSGIQYETLRMLVDTLTSMFRITFMPPKTPSEPVQEMRKAYEAMWKDKAFLSDYTKAIKTEPGVVGGEEGEAIIAKLKTVKPEVKTFLSDYLQKLQKK